VLKTYLDVKSGYSFFQSTLKVNDIITLAKQNNIQALGLCDVNGMYGMMEFYKQCQKVNIKPIVGMEVKVICDDENSYSLLLLAKNSFGYKNLNRITDLVSKSGKDFSLSYEHLLDYKEGLILIIPVLRSYIGKLLIEDNVELLSMFIEKYQSDFPYLYFGLDYDLAYDWTPFRLLSKKFNLKRIALPYINSHGLLDEEALRVLKAIKEGSQLDSTRDILIGYFDKIIDAESYYTYDEIDNLNEIVHSINVNIESKELQFVSYEKITNIKSDEYLRALCHKGLEKRLLGKVTKEYIERLNHELDVIIEMGFADYFLVVYDYVLFAKKEGMLVGPGRGSAAGSLVSYVLGITDVDPLKYGLMFERFLNKERVSMPDIDVDFPDNQRHEVIKHIQNKYGYDHVAHVITYQTFGARMSLRDTAKALGVELSNVDQLMKKFPSFDQYSSLKEFYQKYDQVKRAIDEDPLYQRVYEIALKIEGLPRQTSLHAAGIVISNEPLKEVIPIHHVDDYTIATQYDMNYIEDCGLLKMDILGLRNLTIITDCLKDINKYFQVDLNVSNISLNEELVFNLINKGKTMGIFQLESPGMNRAIQTVNANSFEDIVAIIALYRPGPMQFIDLYAKRKAGLEEVIYLHPILEPILKYTYGIIIYQEQIMQILTNMAGFSLGRADIIRRAISKKEDKTINSLRSEFIEGCRINKIDFKTASEVFALIERFADYGFNRAHSVSYAMISYIMAYIKAFYPCIFYANILTSLVGISYVGGSSKFMQYILEAKDSNIKLLPPSINKSDFNFKVLDEHHIVFSLVNIKGVNQNLVNNILTEREKGEFDDIFDFIVRMYPYGISEENFLSLINAGCFDEFKINRSTLRKNLIPIMQYGDLFADITIIEESMVEKPVINFVKEDMVETLQKEYEVLGIFLSGIPLENERDKLTNKGYQRIVDLEVKDRVRVFLVLAIQSVRVFKTKKNQMMCHLTCYDETGFIDVTVFPSLYQSVSPLLKKQNYIKIDANTQIYNGKFSLVASRILPYELGEELNEKNDVN